MKEQVKISFSIDKELRTELNIIAKRQDTTVTAILTEFITNFVNENK